MNRLGKMLPGWAFAAAALLALAAPAFAQDAGDKIRIHYFRPDGSYDGWGLHVWESFQKAEEASDEFAKKDGADRPVTNVTWFKPLPQSGKDDFGVYWEMPAKEFANGRVNYIIHKGDKKEQGNQDKFFLIKDGADAYVISGDLKVYQNKDEALKAKK